MYQQKETITPKTRKGIKIMNTLFIELDAACDRNELTLLTTDNIQALIADGTRIQVINYGYAGQHNVDDFIPGSLVTRPDGDLELHTTEGRNTYIRYSAEFDHGDHTFYMGDPDRGVMFRTVK